MSRSTPMMEQFKEIKALHSDAILFFRVGDFYEMFYEDAHTAARELNIALTSRDGNKEEGVPLAGIPWHSANTYLARLLNKGYKVAICEQVEEPAQARGLVRRAVTRVITPGTRFEDHLLQQDKNNYLCFLVMLKDKSIGTTFVDISTGELHAFHFSDSKAKQKVFDEIYRFQPAELLINDQANTDVKLHKALSKAGISHFNEAAVPLNLDEALNIITKQFSPESLANWDMQACPAAAFSTAAALQYLHEVQKAPLKHISGVNMHFDDNTALLDAVTLHNLEVMETLRTRDKKSSLIGVLNRTKTAMGSRLLRKWLERPLCNAGEMTQRWNAVGELKENQILREELTLLLKKIYDLERLCSRINLGAVNPRDFLALKGSLQVLPEIANSLKETHAEMLRSLWKEIPSFSSLIDRLEQAIADDAPFALKEGGIFKEGFAAEIDELRQVMHGSKNWLQELERKERERSGIKSLKIRYNKVFGYYIEITKTNLDLVPADYVRKQTLLNAERFITEELKEKESIILSTAEKLIRVEYNLFEELRLHVTGYTVPLQQCAQVLATLDSLISLAEVAAMRGYCKPRLSAQPIIRIIAGRHPVVERTLPFPFVPNDLFLDDREKRILIITGPNMAGKSTYCRSMALLVLMAQAGSFVPADELEFMPVENIFARVGASDDLSSGRSTFMVEMEETASIISNVSTRSLIVLDEIGRGTSTYDGISIARAVLEHLHAANGAAVLFSTHFHELTALEDEFTAVQNLSVAVKETEDDGVIFLHRVIPGRANRSYGINVARLAHLPDSLIARAEQILAQMEGERYGTADGQNSINTIIAAERSSDFTSALCPGSNGQLTLFETEFKQNEAANYERKIIEEIKEMDLLKMTPLKALNKLFSIQSQIKKENAAKEKER